MIRLKRIYDPPDPQDGARYLVERLWPRGITRQAAALAGWLKDLAPSPALRRWFGHDPLRWADFERRYEAELRSPAKQAMLRELREEGWKGTVTLVFAARDAEHNSAVVLKRLADRTPSGRCAVARPPRRRR